MSVLEILFVYVVVASPVAVWLGRKLRARRRADTTNFPLAPDPKKSRIENRGGGWQSR